ncbi:hypothetical protein Emed_000085 [Eimeria media]
MPTQLDVLRVCLKKLAVAADDEALGSTDFFFCLKRQSGSTGRVDEAHRRRLRVPKRSCRGLRFSRPAANSRMRLNAPIRRGSAQNAS